MEAPSHCIDVGRLLDGVVSREQEQLQQETVETHSDTVVDLDAMQKHEMDVDESKHLLPLPDAAVCPRSGAIAFSEVSGGPHCLQAPVTSAVNSTDFVVDEDEASPALPYNSPLPRGCSIRAIDDGAVMAEDIQENTMLDLPRTEYVKIQPPRQRTKPCGFPSTAEYFAPQPTPASSSSSSAYIANETSFRQASEHNDPQEERALTGHDEEAQKADDADSPQAAAVPSERSPIDEAKANEFNVETF